MHMVSCGDLKNSSGSNTEQKHLNHVKFSSNPRFSISAIHCLPCWTFISVTPTLFSGFSGSLQPASLRLCRYLATYPHGLQLYLKVQRLPISKLYFFGWAPTGFANEPASCHCQQIPSSQPRLCCQPAFSEMSMGRWWVWATTLPRGQPPLPGV